MATIAYATTSSNTIGADAGVSIADHASGEIAREDVDLALDLNDDGDLDEEIADAILNGLGFYRTGTWTASGGQYATEVESV